MRKPMFKACDKWFPGYLRSLLSRPRAVAGTRHLFVAVCDHFEPFRDGADADTARRTARDWLAAYPAAVEPFRDADGLPPRHTFFYPQEEYDAAILDDLAAFCRRGYGEVEIHLHHRHDTAAGLREKLINFRDVLHHRHGLLGCSVVQLLSECANAHSSPPLTTQQLNNSITCRTAALPQYGFIHGNWALCNSRPDGDWCGVNEELGILAETGCYADFTFPSAPSPTQPKMVNAIYYATDIPGQPRGADRGELLSCSVAKLPPPAHGEEISCQVAKLLRESADASSSLPSTTQHPNNLTTVSSPSSTTQPCVAKAMQGRQPNNLTTVSSPSLTTQQLNNSTTAPLLLITGPLALNWGRRKWGILPRLENAEITGVNPPTRDRVRLWVRQGIGVAGRPDWVFVKLHTHGCVGANAKVLLGDPMRAMHEVLQREFNDGKQWQLHYVTAREMHNLVKAAEANLPGSPNQYRDTPIAWNR